MRLSIIAAVVAGYALGVATSSARVKVERSDPMDEELLSEEGEVDPVDQEAPEFDEYEYDEFLDWFYREDDTSKKGEG